MIVTNKDIKQAYMDCEMRDPEGLYADEVDLYELGRAFERRMAMKYARAERAECIEFVRSLNPEVARALEEKRGKM